MARKLSDREMRKIERWARSNKKSEMIDFFSELPRRVVIPEPMLLGSRRGNDFLIEGYTVTSAIIEEIFFLDDEYIDLPFAYTNTKVFSKRHERFDNVFWQALSEGKRLDPGKTCLTASLGNCTSQIVSAHAIQKSELKRLARPDGHVYGFLFGGKSDHRNFSWPEPVGINVATTFTGICSHHDNSLFRPIETEEFTASRSQLFLFHYRALIFEHYRRTHRYEKLKRIYTKLSAEGFAGEFRGIATMLEDNKHDSKEIEDEKVIADSLLKKDDHLGFESACWVSDSPAPIAGIISIGPVKDFVGKRIQHPVGNSPLEWVTLTVSPKGGKTVFIIGSNVKNFVFLRLVESFDAIAPAKRMQSLISYCLCCMEDIIFMPQFWESLTIAQQEAIVRTYKARYFPRKMPSLGVWDINRIV
jgi:hypothetical protein